MGVTWATGKFYSLRRKREVEAKIEKWQEWQDTVGEIKQGVGGESESEIKKRKSQRDVRPPKTLH